VAARRNRGGRSGRPRDLARARHRHLAADRGAHGGPYRARRRLGWRDRIRGQLPRSRAAGQPRRQHARQARHAREAVRDRHCPGRRRPVACCLHHHWRHAGQHRPRRGYPADRAGELPASRWAGRDPEWSNRLRGLLRRARSRGGHSSPRSQHCGRGRQVPVSRAVLLAIAPDGKTLYVVQSAGPGSQPTVTAINVTTGRAGRPISLGIPPPPRRRHGRHPDPGGPGHENGGQTHRHGQRRVGRSHGPQVVFAR